jgi:hypothetical protein
MFWKSILVNERERIVIVAVVAIVVGGGSARADFIFGEPTNLGAPVNSAYDECGPYVSPDGLSLYFSGLWLSTREAVEDDWNTPVNLGPPINTPANEHAFCLSADGLVLYFGSDRLGGCGGYDLWVATRASTDDLWGEPNNLGSQLRVYRHLPQPLGRRPVPLLLRRALCPSARGDGPR